VPGTPEHLNGQPRPIPASSREKSALDVLLRCFVHEIGAQTGMVLARDAEAEAQVLSIWGLDGVQPSAPWITNGLLDRAFDAPEAIIEIEFDPARRNGGSNGQANGASHPATPVSTAVAAPIVGVAGRLGAIYAGFAGETPLPDDHVRWTADSYARLVALCMDGGEGLASALMDSDRDRLTGCLSHEGVFDVLKIEIHRAMREHNRLSCCFIDLDGFKLINDLQGHLAGNRVLASVGMELREGARPYDTVGRFGGDEWVLVLPYTGGPAARRTADRMRARVSTAVAAATGIPLFISAGVAEWRVGDSALDLLDAADRALAEAKQTGGARVAVAQSPNHRNDGVVELTKALVRGRSGPRHSSEYRGGL
jgi:diguanylate cyclase (GGDEF)-like protein